LFKRQTAIRHALRNDELCREAGVTGLEELRSTSRLPCPRPSSDTCM
jgi:hypothetical protein